jgi:hypothetical protein
MIRVQIFESELSEAAGLMQVVREKLIAKNWEEVSDWKGPQQQPKNLHYPPDEDVATGGSRS